MKKIFFAFIGFLGWILSPFTWWNDAFINIPLAYISASLINRALPRGFLAAFLISYWFTNILGIFMMYLGAEKLTAKELVKKNRKTLLTAIAVYSAISAALIGFEIVKPF